MRVLSLIASATEIVHALNYGEKLIDRSHECDYPAEVLHLPHCTKPRFNIDGTSIEIDQRVKSILQEALSVYHIDEAKLSELKPDIIITQSQCEVCAVSENDVQKAVKSITGKEPQIVSVEPNSLDDIWCDIKNISEALGDKKSGLNLIRNMKNRMNQLTKLVKGKKKRTVASIEWIDPLMSAGNWVPELIEMAGGINLFGITGKHSLWMDFKDLCDKDPEVLIIMPCGYGIEKSLIEMKTLTSTPGWDNLSAVKKNQVYVTDGNQYFNRPGPRLVASLEILIEILYEGLFNFGHYESSWIRLK